MGDKQIQVSAALAQQLGEEGVVAVTRYDLARIAWKLYKQDQFNSVTLRKQRNELDRPTFNRTENQLVKNGVLRPVSGLPDGSAYILVGANASNPRVLACAIDPFCYISHLSAMEFHGLTDRLPEFLYIASPASTEWRNFAQQRMQKDLGDDFKRFVELGIAPLQRTKFTKLAGRAVHQFKSVHLGAFVHIKDQHIRVATLGRTFLEMLREPALCGGIAHVLSVFREHAPITSRLIIDEVAQHGNSIDKVRAGYVLQEICKISDPRIDAWVAFAQRGGSRKLDASAEYSSTFSEKWCLSINTPIPLEWS